MAEFQSGNLSFERINTIMESNPENYNTVIGELEQSLKPISAIDPNLSGPDAKLIKTNIVILGQRIRMNAGKRTTQAWCNSTMFSLRNLPAASLAKASLDATTKPINFEAEVFSTILDLEKHHRAVIQNRIGVLKRYRDEGDPLAKPDHPKPQNQKPMTDDENAKVDAFLRRIGLGDCVDGPAASEEGVASDGKNKSTGPDTIEDPFAR